MKKTAFTLVELIVVITILAILATIGFVSFSGYLAGTRDTNRIAQLKSMSDALELYRTKKDLPIPDDKVDVQASGTTIAYQGYIGANVLETIEYTEKGLDPKDKVYFSYYLTKNKKYFQLLSFLEEPTTDILANDTNNNLLNTTQAVDYSSRVAHVKGKKLGILTDENNTPIQELSTITATGFIDLNDVGTTVYRSIISDEEITSGSGTTLSSTISNGSCKRIKQIKGGSGDGSYVIDPAGDGLGFSVYCDMESSPYGFIKYFNDSSEVLLMQNFENNGIDSSDSANETLLSTSGLEFEKGIIGNSALFDNISGGVNIIENNFSGLGAFSISTWVKPIGDHRNYTGTIFSSGNRNTDHWALGLRKGNTAIQMRNPSILVNYNFILGEWQHLSVARDGSGSVKVYVNGELISTVTTTSTPLISNAVNSQIGRETYAGGYFAFNGGIDNLRLYNREITLLEVRGLYNEGK